MNTRNPRPESQSDGFEPIRLQPRAARTPVMDRTATCSGSECPADGVACDRADGDCEVCGRSALTYA